MIVASSLVFINIPLQKQRQRSVGKYFIQLVADDLHRMGNIFTQFDLPTGPIPGPDEMQVLKDVFFPLPPLRHVVIPLARGVQLGQAVHFDPPVVHQSPVLVLGRLSNPAADLFELELHYLLGLVHHFVEVSELVVGDG